MRQNLVFVPKAKVNLVWIVPLGLLGWSACSDDASTNSGKKGTPADISGIGAADGENPDANPDAAYTSDGGAPADTATPIDFGSGGPSPGEAGYPCDNGSECFSGICANGPDGKVCAASCGTEAACPDGWVCSQVQTLPDLIFVCVYAMQNLCKPCLTDADCLGLYGEPPGSCIIAPNENGSFCSYACKSSTQCPSGSICADSDSHPGQWCFPEDGVCECQPKWEGATTGCGTANEIGKCTGTKTCKSGQFTQCSAQVASVETCNNKDDDCDGAIDEDTDGAACTVANEIGLCTGIAVCIGGKSICGAQPAIPELCDGLDNDCDGAIDEGFADTDQDSIADCVDPDKDGDGIANPVDNCPDVANPGQNDLDLDGKGDDCDVDVDGDLTENAADNCPTAANPDQQDFDNDGIGDVCDPDDDGDGDVDLVDCAPLNALIFHGAVEVCNDQDDNCNGIIDDPNSPGCQLYFYDQDKDQFGIAGATQCLCEPAAPFSASQPGDCNDQSSQVFPGANELCNGKDDNCDGIVDEADAIGCVSLSIDLDGDGWGGNETVCLCKVQPGYVTKSGDCNDADATISPQATETCNLADDDCDNQIDEVSALGCQKTYLDADNDGFGVAADSLCLCQPTDGYTALVAGDCNDASAEVFPTSIELCDGIDNNCNGQIDEGVKITYYIDVDQDGHGAAYNTKEACQTPPGYADLGGDCNDFNPTMSPSAAEVCDKIDNNCNGLVDEGLPLVKVYVDLDGDGFGAKGTAGSVSCLWDNDGDLMPESAPAGFSLVASDCNDSASTVYPGAPELCDGILNDCLSAVADYACPQLCEGAWPVPLGVTSGHATVAQLDTNNSLEIVVQGAGTVRMIDPLGAIKWTSAASVQYSHPILAAANTDDYLDVFLIETNGVRILDGTNGAELESFDTYGTGWRPGAVFDLDNDGITDIVTSGENKFTIVLRNGLGGAKAIYDISPPPGSTFSADTPGIWDINGDGIAEIIMGTGYYTCNSPGSPNCNGLMVIVDGQTGQLVTDPSLWFVVPDPQNAYAGGSSPLFADVDGDGATEVLHWFGNNIAGAELLGWNLDGSPKALPPWVTGSTPVLAPIDEAGNLVADGSLRTVHGAAVDLDGDGKYETIRVDSNGLRVFEGTNPMDGYPVKVSGEAPLVADIQRDGRLDILYVGVENAALNCYTLGEGTYSDAQVLTTGPPDPFATSRYRTGAFDAYEPNDRAEPGFDPVTSTNPTVDSRAFPFLGMLDKYNSANGWSRSLRAIVGHKNDRDYYYATGKQIFVTLNTFKNLIDLDLYVHIYKPAGAKWQYLATWSSTSGGNESIQCHSSSPCPDVASTNLTKTFIIEVRSKDPEVDFGPWPYDLRIVWGAK